VGESGRKERICKGCEAEQIHQEIRQAYPDSSKLFDLETRLTKEIIARQQAEARLERLLRSPSKEASANSSLSPSRVDSPMQGRQFAGLSLQRVENEQISPVKERPPLKAKQEKKLLSISPHQQVSVPSLAPGVLPTTINREARKLSLSPPLLSSVAAKRNAVSLRLQQVGCVSVSAAPPSPLFQVVMEDSKEETRSKHEHAQTFSADHPVTQSYLKDSSHAGRLETVEESECVRCKQHEASIKRLMLRLQDLERGALPSRRSNPDLQSSKNCQCVLY
jgi:hypothetical protein